MIFQPFQFRLENLLKKAGKEGLEVYNFCGFRSHEDQAKLYGYGRATLNPDGALPGSPLGRIVTRAQAGESWHQYGCAADLVFKVKGQWSWDASLPWKRLGELGQAQDLEWGGAWLGQKVDLPHFQLTGGVKIWQAQQLYLQGGMDAVWQEISNGLGGK